MCLNGNPQQPNDVTSNNQGVICGWELSNVQHHWRCDWSDFCRWESRYTIVLSEQTEKSKEKKRQKGEERCAENMKTFRIQQYDATRVSMKERALLKRQDGDPESQGRTVRIVRIGLKEWMNCCLPSRQVAEMREKLYVATRIAGGTSWLVLTPNLSVSGTRRGERASLNHFVRNTDCNGVKRA